MKTDSKTVFAYGYFFMVAVTGMHYAKMNGI